MDTELTVSYSHAVFVKERAHVQVEQGGQLLPQHSAGATLQRKTTTIVVVVKNLDVGHGCSWVEDGLFLAFLSYLLVQIVVALNVR
jgi:hypothetical protein